MQGNNLQCFGRLLCITDCELGLNPKQGRDFFFFLIKSTSSHAIPPTSTAQ